MSKKLKRSEKLRSDDVGIPLVSTIAEIGALEVMGWPANAASLDMEGDRASLSKDRYLKAIAVVLRKVIASSRKEGASDPYGWINKVRCRAVGLDDGKSWPICLVIVGDGKGSARSIRLRHDSLQKEITDAIAAAEAGALSDDTKWTPLQVKIHQRLMEFRKEKDSVLIEFYLPDQVSRAKSIRLDKCRRLKVFLPEQPTAQKESRVLSGNVTFGEINSAGSTATLMPDRYDSPDAPLGGVTVSIRGEIERQLVMFAKAAGESIQVEARYLKTGTRNEGRLRSSDFSVLEGIRLEVLKDERGNLYMSKTKPKRAEASRVAANDPVDDDDSNC